MEYWIMLAIDRCTALTFGFLAASWWKIHSHVVDSFPWFSPIFMSVYILPWVSSYSGVWSLQGSSYICILVKLDPFRFRKSPPQRENIAKYSGKEVDLGRICSTNSIFVIKQSFRLGHRTTLYHEGLINVNRNLDKSLYKKEDFKHWDR